MAPKPAIPNKQRMYSGQLGMNKATTSPFLIPKASKEIANFLHSPRIQWMDACLSL